ncbi:MAG: alpha/beta hydrolase [Candidatus Woesearchaeota archaeon]
MKNAIIIHGTCDKEEYYSKKYPSASNSHFLPWLQKQLLIKDIHAITPEMYKSYMPNYGVWKSEFEKNKIDENTILVGHSCGAGFIIRWLSENKNVSVDKVVLVAPWLDPFNEKKNNFFDFKIDENLASRINKLVVFNSTNDMQSIQKSLEIIKEKIKNIKIVDFENYGHFTHEDMGTDKFPELLNELI